LGVVKSDLDKFRWR